MILSTTRLIKRWANRRRATGQVIHSFTSHAAEHEQRTGEKTLEAEHEKPSPESKSARLCASSPGRETQRYRDSAGWRLSPKDFEFFFGPIGQTSIRASLPPYVLFHPATVLLALPDAARLSLGPKSVEHGTSFSPASFLASQLLALFPAKFRPPFFRPQGIGLPSDFNFASHRSRPAVIAATVRAMPSGVVGPVERPPWKRQRLEPRRPNSCIGCDVEFREIAR